MGATDWRRMMVSDVDLPLTAVLLFSLNGRDFYSAKEHSPLKFLPLAPEFILPGDNFSIWNFYLEKQTL